MSYIVLARKWRPMQFEEVVGQEHITRTLMNALEQNRIAHSFIFAGPRGVGKTTTARILAKAVNCENQPTVNPCNNCSSCKSITAGRSLDMIEIDGASNRGIDEIRNLRENIRFAPAVSKYKIYIIDEVHMLTKEAFNALLKTLEEPPSHAIFIFATTEIHRVPLTILSRCQRFDFKRIPTNLIVDLLETIAKSEKIKIDRESLLLIARKSEGSMRDAESILDQMIAYTNGKISVEDVQNSLGLISEEMFFEYTDLLLEKNDTKIINFTQKVINSGHDLLDFLYGLQAHIRNLLVARATGSVKLLETIEEIKKLYKKNAQHFNENDLIHFFEILSQSEQILKFSPNPQLILELLLIKLAHKPLGIDIEKILDFIKNSPQSRSETRSQQKQEISNPEKVLQEQTTVYPQKKKVEPQKEMTTSTVVVNEAPRGPFERLKIDPFPKEQKRESQIEKPLEKTSFEISLPKIQDQWDKIVETIKAQKIALGSFLMDGVPYKVDSGYLEIAFDPKTHFHLDHIQKNCVVIEQILHNQFKYPLKIRCISLDFENADIEKKVHTAEEIIEDIKSKEPVLKKIIEMFDCKEIEDNEFRNAR
jgi:DNA polymerase-3 subunit gamma/tau